MRVEQTAWKPFLLKCHGKVDRPSVGKIAQPLGQAATQQSFRGHPGSEPTSYGSWDSRITVILSEPRIHFSVIHICPVKITLRKNMIYSKQLCLLVLTMKKLFIDVTFFPQGFPLILLMETFFSIIVLKQSTEHNTFPSLNAGEGNVGGKLTFKS